jgi:molybdopterin converting factor small subunit
MRVHVRLLGHLQMYTDSKNAEFELELPTETTLAGLIRNLKIPNPEVWVVSVNGNSVVLSTVLSNDDIISIFPPVTGG